MGLVLQGSQNHLQGTHWEALTIDNSIIQLQKWLQSSTLVRGDAESTNTNQPTYYYSGQYSQAEYVTTSNVQIFRNHIASRRVLTQKPRKSCGWIWTSAHYMRMDCAVTLRYGHPNNILPKDHQHINGTLYQSSWQFLSLLGLPHLL